MRARERDQPPTQGRHISCQASTVVRGAVDYISRTILRRKLIGVLFNGRLRTPERFKIVSDQTPPCVKLRMAGFTAWNAGVLMKISMAMRMKIPACRREREESRRRTQAYEEQARRTRGRPGGAGR